MSFTMNDLALLLIALIVGWLLGLMMSGRGKYKRLWRDEQIAHRTVLKERDGAIRERDARIEAANARIAELERHRDGEHQRMLDARGVSVECLQCGGTGVYAYPDTSMWRGGAGGRGGRGVSPTATEPKGTDSQEYLRKEQREIFETVRDRVKLREENEADNESRD